MVRKGLAKTFSAYMPLQFLVLSICFIHSFSPAMSVRLAVRLTTLSIISSTSTFTAENVVHFHFKIRVDRCYLSATSILIEQQLYTVLSTHKLSNNKIQ